MIRGLRWLVLLCVFTGCSQPSERVEFSVRNNTERRLRIVAKAGGFSRTIEVGPGGHWDGWFHRAANMKDVEIAVEDAP